MCPTRHSRKYMLMTNSLSNVHDILSRWNSVESNLLYGLLYDQYGHKRLEAKLPWVDFILEPKLSESSLSTL